MNPEIILEALHDDSQVIDTEFGLINNYDGNRE
jgi:hypothetical protein